MERYIIARILAVGFIMFLVIFMIIAIATSGSNGDEETQTPVEEAQIELPVLLSDLHDTNNSSVQYVIKGKTEGLEEHDSLRFTISKNRRTIEYITGYNGRVAKSQSLPNTEEAYEEFLHAIEFNGFDTPKEEPTITDPRGVCALGRQYFYRVKIGASTKDELWTASCSSKYGTFGGSRSTIDQLFELQFPNQKEFRSGISLY